MNTHTFMQQLQSILTESQLSEGKGDIEMVSGEEWLPERLLSMKLDNNLLFLTFDDAPIDDENIERGLVDHEVDLIKTLLSRVLKEADEQTKIKKLLLLIMLAHKQSSNELVESLEKILLTEYPD
ncbi:hypothetical protein N9R79_00070 [Vibrio sp.]|nr:hypothetical protein [Vibrio sp.]